MQMMPQFTGTYAKIWINQSLRADLFCELSSNISIQNWFVTFYLSKTKLEMFHHHQVDPEFSSHDDNSILNEHLLRLKVTPRFKWNSSRQSNAQEAGKIVSSMQHSIRYLIPPIMHYLTALSHSFVCLMSYKLLMSHLLPKFNFVGSTGNFFYKHILLVPSL